ncbi:MAG: DUF368 domain-containing protein, partial [bacterium]|nr:DUF368 domain-containing protein [bacterium]
ICAMILPGISGAFILVLLGKYHYVLDAVNNRNIWVLFLVAAGAGLGLITFARFLDWLFKKHHDKTIAVLTGLMIGSLRKVWPWKETLQSLGNGHGGLIPIKQANILPPHMNIEVIVALCLMAAGLITVIILEKSQTAEDDLLPAGPEGETEA